ncbi:MAG: VIT1/CCC1 transporter family protein [Candidatus Micrarchaeia archaeon]
MEEEVKNRILFNQRNEITEHLIYKKLAELTKEGNNRRLLERISKDELRHYGVWKRYTGKEVEPDGLKVWWYVLVSRVFGITFGLKLMEKGEVNAEVEYKEIGRFVREAKRIAKEEDEHERKLLGMIDEERLRYVGSVVLGLNDALVELTASLAGLTLALQRTDLVGMAGLITGIAASFSMGASEYHSTKTEEGEREPVKAAVYTTIAYLLTVLFLILPYFVFKEIYTALAFTVLNAIIVIFLFTFYVSVAKDVPFKRRFVEMALISLGVSAVTFGIGFLVRVVLNIEV